MKRLWIDFPFGLSSQPNKEYETVIKNLIYIFSIFLICGLVACLSVVFIDYYEGSCNASSSVSMDLEYIWPDNVKKIINNVVDNNMHVTNDDRGVLIKTELMRFKTNDVFYIIVYNDVSGPSRHVFYGNQNEYITVFKPRKCNVVVFRSKFWTGSPDYALVSVTKEIEDVKRTGIVEKSDYSDTLKELFKNFHDINFLGLIEKENDVSIRSANSFGRIWGPGYWHTIKVLDEKTKEETGKEFILIAGYK